MTTAPALQALIEQWREQWATGDTSSAKMARQCVLALERTLQAHPVVSVDELERVVDSLDEEASCKADCTRALRVLLAKYTPQSPSPHPQGTYLWARHEHLSGKVVGRRELDIDGVVRFAARGGRGNWDSAIFHHCDFTATDWEVVS